MSISVIVSIRAFCGSQWFCHSATSYFLFLPDFRGVGGTERKVSSVLQDTDFVGSGINISVLNFTPVTNVCRTEVPLSTFGLFRCVRDVPEGVC